MAFHKVDTADEQIGRIVTAVWGLPKEGKTTFALSAPAPIYYFNFDFGYREAAGRTGGKELYVADYAMAEEFDPSVYLPMVAQFKQDWAEAIEQADARGGTVVLDTASQAWQMIGPTMVAAAAAKASRNSDKKMRTDWGPANLLMSTLLRRPYQYERVNAIYIQRAKEIYNEAGAATGKFQPHGFGETESIVQILLNIVSKKEVQTNKTGQPVLDSLGRPKMTSKVFGTIDCCRFGKEFEGLALENPTYDSLLALIG